jgi:hypothetical protein
MDIYFWLREMAIEAQYKEGMESEKRRRLLEAADEIKKLREERSRLREALKEIATEEYIDPKMIAEEALWYSKAARAALKENS